MIGEFVDVGSVIGVGVLLWGVVLVSTFLSGFEVFKARNKSSVRMAEALTKFLFVMMFVIYPCIHFFLLLADASALQRSRYATDRVCSNEEVRRAWGGHESSKERCPESVAYEKWTLMVWVTSIWDYGVVGLYVGHNIEYLYTKYVYTNVVAQAIPAIGIGGMIAIAVVSYVYIKVNTRETPQVYRKGDQICWKMPDGEEKCACVHEEAEKKSEPQPSSGPSISE